jgi:hypothetical protein
MLAFGYGSDPDEAYGRAGAALCRFVALATAGLVFAGLVLLQGLLRPITSANELGVALSTLVSFTLFQPSRRRIHSVVD